MPATAEKCVKTCIQKIKETFDGFGEDAVQEFYKIMIDEVRGFGETVRKETMASAVGGSDAVVDSGKPRLRRVNNYTLFGNDYRKAHPEFKEDMFRHIADAWKASSDAVKKEWKDKADAENARLKEEYVKEHGEVPRRRKVKAAKPKTTNPFQEYVKEFRGKNPKIGHKEVFGEASKAWKKMTDKQKKKYQDAATALREEYKTAWEEERKNNPVPAEAEEKGTAKRESKPRPKTCSGYILFGNHWREKLNTTKLTGKLAMAEIAKAWAALSEKEQGKFKADAEKDNKKIVDAFLKEFPDTEWSRKHAASEKKAAEATA